ncbi:MAG: right-handed parallel beta-helix repeat-containing protein [Caldilineaceae bacterium]
MGLTVDGRSILLRDPANPQRLAGGGIHIASDNNEIAANTIAGAYAPAITIDGGDNNLVELNYIGTRVDGTVPDVPDAIRCLRSFSYDPSNWYGGWGINLSGSNNDVSRNLIAGLHILQAANDTPPRAIEIFGSNHRITENIIGGDFDDNPAGVCGQGIKVSGSDTLIADNMITGSRLDSEDAEPAAILASDTSPLFGQITVRGNLVDDGPGKVYGFGPGIPDALRLFAPAAVTAVTATTISGTSGADSPCPNCEIDVYLDNLDDNQEAFIYAGSATADGDGNWSLAIPQPVPANAGIRTASTTTSSGVIGTYGAGTSTKLSDLYVTPTNVAIAGPSTGQAGTQYQFDMTTTPATTESIYDYTVTVTDFDAPLTGRFSSLANARLTWSEPGVKTIEVRVETALGAVTATHTITIAGNDPDPTPTPDPTPEPTPAPSSSGDVYLPLVHRP